MGREGARRCVTPLPCCALACAPRQVGQLCSRLEGLQLEVRHLQQHATMLAEERERLEAANATRGAAQSAQQAAAVGAGGKWQAPQAGGSAASARAMASTAWGLGVLFSMMGVAAVAGAALVAV